MKNKLLYLLFIILLAGFLRFFQISSNPPSLTWDEVAWGYNAYSIGLDGKDEFGVLLPYKYLESFGDFKPPVYAYLDVVPVKIFGLNEFATRFPSAFFGTLTVLLTYFLTLQIFFNSKRKEYIALFATLMLAISPWHINLSRAAFEANVATFFLVGGVLTFLYAINRRPWFLILSAISFVISMYTFNTSRVVAPLLVIMLGLLFIKKLWQIKKQSIVAIIVGLWLFLPIAGFLLSPQAGLRFKEVNIFSNPDEVLTSNQEIKNDNNASWSKIIHNRRLLYGVSFVEHYFDNISPDFLFIKGDGNPKFSTQDVGELYLWSLPFLIIGSLFVFRRREGHWYIVPLWLLLGIIPAATARETPHSLRIETVIPTFQILVAYGVVVFIEWLKQKKFYFKSILTLVFILLFFNVFYYLYGYYVHYAYEFSGQWQYGYKESISYVSKVENKYDEIVVNNFMGRPYIYYLFYLKIPSSEFRENSTVHRDAFGFVDVKRVGKFYFVNNMNQSKFKNKKVLYIDDATQVPKGAHILKTFDLLDGTPILEAYTFD